MKDYIATLSALLTPIVAVVGSVIAVQQWRIADRKLRHELYERRLAVYMALTSLMGTIAREADVSLEELSMFLQKTRESHFLFSENIQMYLDDIYKAAVDVRSHASQLHENGLPIGEKRTDLAKKNTELLHWFSSQWPVARKKFAKEMGLA